MSRSKSLGLSAVFLAIALFVSATLVMSLRETYAVDGHAPAIRDAIHLLQKA
ncbi:MAG: hypothetical protein ACTHOR_13140 [Devosia sp.]|jgi:hypothetical protein|nr:hypothetical protein [Devosiaceae bacterium]